MSEEIFRASVKQAESIPASAALYTAEGAERTRRCHRSFPEYCETPLVRLNGLACELGVGGIFVKDESKRFGLNAFKALGSSYAICSLLAEKLGLPQEQAVYPVLTSAEAKEKLGEMTFVTATDGNHGRGMAWSATKLGHRSVVYMPAGSVQERLENIRKAGADASITPWVYDDTVRFARSQAEKNGWILVQDTALSDGDRIPEWIMQGYLTMASEALEQMNGEVPTHIFLQAGVGSMAAAVAAFFSQAVSPKPRIIIVEPHSADCVFRTAAAADGKLHAAPGPMKTIMAGLCCGEVCAPAWTLLHAFADDCLSIPDSAAADGMRVLGAPLPGDGRIISGESGASGFGAALAVLRRPENEKLRGELGLDRNARVLCFSTEGATDRANYRDIVWNGAFSGR